MVFIFFNLPVQLIVLDLVSIAAALGVGYYAARMYYHLRQGRLEKGWSQILLGATVIACGYFFLTVEDLFLAYSSFYLSVDYIGTVICTLGLIILMLGLRSHYSAWVLRRSERSAQKATEDQGDRDKLVDLK
jgi:hypothetical protein